VKCASHSTARPYTYDDPSFGVTRLAFAAHPQLVVAHLEAVACGALATAQQAVAAGLVNSPRPAY
jgi:hypothetical protein